MLFISMLSLSLCNFLFLSFSFSISLSLSLPLSLFYLFDFLSFFLLFSSSLFLSLSLSLPSSRTNYISSRTSISANTLPSLLPFLSLPSLIDSFFFRVLSPFTIVPFSFPSSLVAFLSHSMFLLSAFSSLSYLPLTSPLLHFLFLFTLPYVLRNSYLLRKNTWDST